MSLSDILGFLPKRMENCPNCGSKKTGVILYHTGNDNADIRRAAKRGYLVHYIPRNEKMYENRFCFDCWYMWNHEELEAQGVLQYDDDRPELEFTVPRNGSVIRSIRKKRRR